MHSVYLSLGSNMGDRQDYLRRAIASLGENPGILMEQVSRFYETSPVGGVVQDDFINVALKLSTTLGPDELLAFIHEVEAKLGRERLIHWGPRTIDIDILLYDELEMNSDDLTLPHPELFKRLFVLEPLAELLPDDGRIKTAIEQLSKTDQAVQVVEAEAPAEERLEDAVGEILKAVGEDPSREGLLETPSRVAKMYAEILSSQKKAKFDEYKLFKIDVAEQDQEILVKDIPFYSMCEHHMLPFFGVAHVAYLPTDGNIIGLSKIPRLVDYVSRRLSVQENITREIAETMNEILKPKGVAVLVEARHMCIEMRGVKKLNSKTKTTFFLGEYDSNLNQRQEFLEAIK
ncbi:GTP cyclohydrolase I FolE [Lactococcus termiticola]|uniref:GTP cyclohydrolase 1 n=1 Tax=Lactococcus termiticola TaxID=2169526 RepID=A0A2R5HG69_9LACT|nr:GTP cyclohydrolase I FolE [Lactococcus termiticola]GBG97063.1 GTP cyclohydrolase I [Lactococcus termiticola]